MAEQFPNDVGFENRANWTLTLAAQYVEREWSVSYSLKGMSNVLKWLSLSFIRRLTPLKRPIPKNSVNSKKTHFQC